MPDAGPIEDGLNRLHLRPPDFKRVLLHPAGMGIARIERDGGKCDALAPFVIEGSASAGGSLIERQYPPRDTRHSAIIERGHLY
jgi:hypothetical protein